MSIVVEWDNEEHAVMLYTFVGNWTWDELYRSLDVGEEMAKDSPARVHAILDMREGSALPGGSLLTPTVRDHAQTLVSRMHPERGHIVAAGASPLLRSMYGVFHGLFGDKAGDVYFVATPEEARQLLASLQSAQST